MKTIRILFISFAIILSGSVYAGSLKKVHKANKTLENAKETIENIMESSHRQIPRSLLGEMEAIVIIPNAIKAALIWGGQGGRGIALVRTESGEWSNPLFISMGSGSLGFQAGAESSDIILLFKDKCDILRMEVAEITLGTDASLSAGPVCSNASLTTNAKFDTKILSYTYSKGIFAGLSVKGGVLKSNAQINEAYYKKDYTDIDEILFDTDTSANKALIEFLHTLNDYSM